MHPSDVHLGLCRLDAVYMQAGDRDKSLSALQELVLIHKPDNMLTWF